MKMKTAGSRMHPVTALAMAAWLASTASHRVSGRDPTGADAVPRPERIEARTIENFFRLGPKLYSGGDPQGEDAFSILKRLGVRTLISVDGAAPDVETARKYGLRYVHLPIGYDGVSREQAARIVKAASTLPGPVFLHCHHGKHRGPAAAALCAMAGERWSKDHATSWLKRAGTSPEYRGLYATVADFTAPSPDELERTPGDFPERTAPPPLVELMIDVDGKWDAMKAIRESGYRPPASSPDDDPPHMARQLVEQFKELARAAQKSRNPDFTDRAESTAKLAGEFEAALRRYVEAPTEAARKKIDETFIAVGKSCTACHARHRDDKSSGD